MKTVVDHVCGACVPNENSSLFSILDHVHDASILDTVIKFRIGRDTLYLYIQNKNYVTVTKTGV